MFSLPEKKNKSYAANLHTQKKKKHNVHSRIGKKIQKNTITYILQSSPLRKTKLKYLRHIRLKIKR